MTCCTPTCRKWTVFSLGAFFVVLGILTALFCDDIVEEIKRQELNLGNNHTTEYSLWEETPIPMFMEFYLFNWSNWQEVEDSGWTIKPSFTEMGPYVYSEKHLRKQVIFNDNHTVTYKTQRIWHFIPELSSGSLDDKVTTLNTILATLANFIRYKHAIVKMAVNFFLEEKNITLTVTKTVGEYLFDGYDDPMLDLLKKLHLRHINLPFTNFGWFVDRNKSVDYDGVFNMFDGTDDVRKLGKFFSWNYNRRTEYFPSSCGQVEGTSGELWYPVKDDDSIQIFASDVCSTITLQKSGDDESHGIKGYKFIGDQTLFDNGTLHPDMKCFSPGEVLPSGVRNISACKFNAPAFVSYPHFYLADPSYRENIDGMQPNKSKHQFYVSLEPETGIPLKAHAALQVNIRLQKMDRIKLLENVKEHFIPAFWFKQSAEVNNKLASQAKLLLILPAAGTYTGYGIIGIGCLLLIVFGYITLKNHWKGTDGEQLLSQETF